jgi:iron(III) transport system substrate-binding protein
MKALIASFAALAATVTLAACGGEDADLTIYSGRNEQLVGRLLDSFEKESGLKVDVRYGDSAELAATIAEEGDNSPADVFFSQDAGALGSIEDKLAPMPPAVEQMVPERFRDPQSRWVGVSGRARVIAYSTERLEESEVPDSVFDVTDEKWSGRVGIAPPNASFQAFVSAMRLDAGDDRTRTWLEDLAANDAKRYENNIQTVEAIDRGEIDLGLVNHYYLYELKRENPDLAVANHFARDGDPGALVNAAGAGVLRTSEHPEAARRFVRFLLGREAQTYFARDTAEYPLIPGIERLEGLPPIDSVVGPKIELGDLGAKLRSTLELLDEVGLQT